MLVLASQSPRRREILAAAGIPFTVRASAVAEVIQPGELPLQYVSRLARAKAEAVEADRTELVLGADTVVTVEGYVLEKPADRDDARRMLELLSGRDHVVITGICLRQGATFISDYEQTKVRFLTLSAEEIDAYIESGEPDDKAGAYAIQGLASKFVERIEGCYFNVVGLPVALVYRYLRQLGLAGASGQISTSG